MNKYIKDKNERKYNKLRTNILNNISKKILEITKKLLKKLFIKHRKQIFWPVKKVSLAQH